MTLKLTILFAYVPCVNLIRLPQQRCCRDGNDDDSAISAVSKMGRWKEALSMMKQMLKDGVAFDVFTYSGAITACGKGGKADKAIALLDEMVDEYGKLNR